MCSYAPYNILFLNTSELWYNAIKVLFIIFYRFIKLLFYMYELENQGKPLKLT